MIQHKAIAQTRKTRDDVSPSDFIIIFLKQEGQDVSLLKSNNRQLYKGPELNKSKLWMQRGMESQYSLEFWETDLWNTWNHRTEVLWNSIAWAHTPD